MLLFALLLLSVQLPLALTEHGSESILDRVVATDGGGAGSALQDGDELTIYFSTNTDKPPVTGRGDVDKFLKFSAQLGSAYNGTWTDAKTLVIKIYDITDGSWQENEFIYSSSLGPITYNQSSGRFSLAAIADKVSVNDTLAWTCTEAPRTSLSGSTQVASNDFSDIVGVSEDMTDCIARKRLGKYLAPRASTSLATAVGHFVVQAFFRRQDGTLIMSVNDATDNDTAVLSGTWGQESHSNASLVQCIAADSLMSPSPGISFGDTLDLLFEPATLAPTARKVLRFQPSIANMQCSTYQINVLMGDVHIVLPGIPSNSSAANIRSLLEASSTAFGSQSTISIEGFLNSSAGWVIALNTTCAFCRGDVRLNISWSGCEVPLPDTKVDILNDGYALDYKWFSKLFIPSTYLGQNVSGKWITASMLQVEVRNVTGVDVLGTRVGKLSFSLSSSAGRHLWEQKYKVSEQPCQVSGTWGAYPRLSILSALASDTSSPNVNELSVGDVVAITFSFATNTPPVASKDEVDKFLGWGGYVKSLESGESVLYRCPNHCIAPGSDYWGEWVDNSRLLITIKDANMPKDPGYEYQGYYGTPVSPEMQTEIGSFVIFIKEGAVIGSLDESSPACGDVEKETGCGVKFVTGSWGTYVRIIPASQMLYAFAAVLSLIAICLFGAKHFCKYRKRASKPRSNCPSSTHCRFTNHPLLSCQQTFKTHTPGVA